MYVIYSDYRGASLDRKSTTGGCQFLGRRLISWQCKKQTIVANSTIEAEYVAAANCFGQNSQQHLRIDANIAGKPITISEASIRSDLLFDDADRIDSLNNQAIFDTIQLMGPSDTQPIPSPPHPSEDQPQIQPNPSPKPSPITHIPDSIPEGSGGNHEGQSSNDASLSGNEDCLTLQSVYDLCASLCKQVKAQAKEIKALKAQVKKLKRGVKPLITHHKAWMKTRLARKTSLKKKGGTQGVYYMETEDVQDEMRNEGTDKGNEGKSATQTAPTPTSTPTLTTPTLTVFGNDEAIAQVLIIMSQNKEKLKEKEKGVEIRNIEETKRTRPTSTRSILTLRPLPKIDLKDKGKKRIKEEDESDTESKA
ncbi:hypothetical protein Tco_0893700 [Tanacetum coccineum]|uniref:Uncharacterized protein n=1 Tax=Tanacetum coccineum TaxID=301880 RepID=A0ABQ5CCE9_9ASTR